MSGRAFAVLIGNSTFPNEPELAPLRFPENDVDALHELLTSAEQGIFTDTLVLKNRPCQEVRESVNRVLKQAERDDLVLVYYAGHGKLNLPGNLHLATLDTEIANLGATSLPVSNLRDFVEDARSQRVVVILDCCFSGAADRNLNPGSQFGAGRGIYLLTASTRIQSAEEQPQGGHGTFTLHLLEGIRSGAADEDRDGLVGIEELYRYLLVQVPKSGEQRPTLKVFGEAAADKLILARSATPRSGPGCSRSPRRAPSPAESSARPSWSWTRPRRGPRTWSASSSPSWAAGATARSGRAS